MATEANIKHNSYFDGAVQSIGAAEEGAPTSGIVSPGEYDFGTAKKVETIVVVHGRLSINGEQYNEGDECVIFTGNKIKIVAEEVAHYFCTYD